MLNKLISQIGCPSNHLPSLRKSTPIQKPSAQIPKDLISMEELKRQKNYSSMNTLIYPTEYLHAISRAVKKLILCHMLLES